MFLTLLVLLSLLLCFLCLRRDVSFERKSRDSSRPFSLLAQRCFSVLLVKEGESVVFSACAEMFPSFPSFLVEGIGFLCLRRDVSGTLDEAREILGFSLLAQRCFLRHYLCHTKKQVFSACAEMFL